jgi:hypothetical protein
LAKDPSFGLAAQNLAMFLMAEGRWEEAWPLYRKRSVRVSEVASPEWRGGPLSPRTRLLVLGEQGFGDAIQLVRCARILAEQEVHVIWQTRPALTRWFAHQSWLHEVIEMQQPIPDHDVHIRMFDLPAAMGIDPKTIPYRNSYLKVPEFGSVLPIRSRARRLGLVWDSSSGHENLAYKAMPQQHLQTLLRIEDIEWVSLVPRIKVPEGIIDGGALINDFADTAHLLAQLDGIVTIDSAPAHVAGAIGVPGWVLLAQQPDWRWVAGADDCHTPWYRSLTPLRQTQEGDWSGVLDQLFLKLSSPE